MKTDRVFLDLPVTAPEGGILDVLTLKAHTPHYCGRRRPRVRERHHPGPGRRDVRHDPDGQPVPDVRHGARLVQRRRARTGNNRANAADEEPNMTTSDKTDRFPGNEVPPIHCVKCKTKTNNATAERVTMENGRPAMRATCADCGIGKFRFGG